MPDLPRRLRCAPLLGAVLLAACTAAVHSDRRPPVHLGEPEVRALAELVRLEDRREPRDDVLQRSASSVHPELRRRTALAVGRLRYSGGMPLLFELLADADTGVAATAAFAIGLVGDTAAVPRLVTWLNPQRAAATPTLAAEVATALGKLPAASAAAALETFLRAAPVRSTRDPSVEHALLAVWRHPRPADAAPVLRWTEAPHPEVRWRAVYALVRRPEPAATPRLLQLAGDGDARVRALAVRGLTGPLADSAGLQRSDVLPVVLAATRDPDQGTAVNAARSLATFSEPASVHRLAAMLDGETARAVAAAEALGRIGNASSEAVAALRLIALDPDRVIGLRAAALQALATVAPPEAEAAALRLAQEPAWRARGTAGRALAALDPSPRPPLNRLVRDPDARVGAWTLQAAVDASGGSVAPLRELLFESLGAADAQLRTAALSGLARLRDPGTLPLLLDAFGVAQRDTTANAALAALDAIAALQEAGVPASRVLVQRFSRPDSYLLRQRAVDRLGESVRAAWGDPLPIETGLGLDQYQAIARRWIVPPLAGEPLPRVRIETESGVIELRLFPAEAPLTVESFVGLAEQGYFDGQEWPRVVPNFVIQGGDPRGDQSGGPGYAIRDEFNRHRYERGTLGMALSGPDTGGSQFFITHSAQPHLDGGYTVFGEVVAGMDVVDRVVAGERIHRVRRIR
jgi:cyclophilin family peptidyl-prolyl cis-trans isomerase/HEAT repeat protein